MEQEDCCSPDSGFYRTLPALKRVERAEADIAWLVYDLRLDPTGNRYMAERHETVYTRFDTSLDQITKSEPGDENDFISYLQTKLDERLENGNPPEAPTIDAIE